VKIKWFKKAFFDKRGQLVESFHPKVILIFTHGDCALLSSFPFNSSE